eukprot:scaffold5115_cov113-Isochrysis_galbana.AAC.1
MADVLRRPPRAPAFAFVQARWLWLCTAAPHYATRATTLQTTTYSELLAAVPLLARKMHPHPPTHADTTSSRPSRRGYEPTTRLSRCPAHTVERERASRPLGFPLSAPVPLFAASVGISGAVPDVLLAKLTTPPRQCLFTAQRRCCRSP